MPLKIAILDLYDGQPNQGMRCIQDILHRYGQANGLALQIEVFKVRELLQIPDSSFNIYISSGGPGSPLESEGEEWENRYFDLMDKLETINENPEAAEKKYVFLICHSFQLMCRHYNIGKVCKRNSTSFGIFPVHKTGAGALEEILNGLPDPFFAVDSRDYQVIEPDEEKFEALGAKVVALEKVRPHVDLERCLMAIRFNDYFFGTQFHPEADPIGMREHLQNEEKKNQVIALHGEAKYWAMMELLENPQILDRTQSQIIPAFLNLAINALQEA